MAIRRFAASLMAPSVISLIIALTSQVGAAGAPSSRGNSNAATTPIIVRVEDELGRGAFVTYLDDVRLAVPALLTTLGRRLRDGGIDTPVIVLISDRQPVSHIGEIQAVIGKAGARSTRYFHYPRDRRFMGEIFFGNAVPFSLKPRTESAEH